MPTSYTSSLRLAQPAPGENVGTWGELVNDGITALVDTAVAGYVAITVSDANYTLSVANGATDEARRAVLNFTGTLTAARDVVVPGASKVYIVRNSTTGGYALTVKTSGGSGIAVANGTTKILFCDATNVQDALPIKTINSTSLFGSGDIAVATLASPTFTGTPAAPTAAAGTNTTQIATTAHVFAERTNSATLTNKTLTSPTINAGYTEQVYAIVDGANVDLNPANGSIQTWTLGASRSPTATSFASGQSMILGINDGTAYTVTWPSVTWTKVGGSGAAPTLNATVNTWVVLWKVGSTLYGSHLGDA